MSEESHVLLIEQTAKPLKKRLAVLKVATLLFLIPAFYANSVLMRHAWLFWLPVIACLLLYARVKAEVWWRHG